MNIVYLQQALEHIKTRLHTTIQTATFINKKGESKQKKDGLEAKNSLIKSEQLIHIVHEVVKNSIHNELIKQNITSNYKIHPSIGSSSPELNVWGFFKKKAQDVVITFSDPNDEIIIDGALKGQIDKLGSKATEESVVIGIRSQLSSIAKNYDTLMERTFAESLNLRMKNPQVVMGDVYLIPTHEYLSDHMKQNQVQFSNNRTDVESFISIFNSLTGRQEYKNRDNYLKYETSALIIADFNQNPIKIYQTITELKADNIVSHSFDESYETLEPSKFAKNIVLAYQQRKKQIEREKIKVRLKKSGARHFNKLNENKAYKQSTFAKRQELPD